MAYMVKVDTMRIAEDYGMLNHFLVVVVPMNGPVYGFRNHLSF